MDPEQTFMRVHARLSGVLARLLTPRFRTLLEYLFLMNALLLLGLLVNMHVNFVGQPGCASAFWKEEGLQDAQIIQIKITDSWMRTTEETLRSRILPRLQHMEHRAAAGSSDPDEKYDEVPDEGWNVLAAKFWLNLIGTRKSQALKRHAKAGKSDSCVAETPTSVAIPPANGDPHHTETEHSAPEVPAKGPVKSALRHYISSWSSYSSSLLKRSEQNLKTFWQLWGGRKKLGRFAGSGDTERKRERIAGWESTDGSIESDSGPVAWNKPDAVTDGRSRMIEPTYLYSTEKGYLMLSETAKHRSNVKKLNISISAQDLCFGNRWQQFVIDNFVGYDTILMNSLLNVTGNGYLYNFQTKELYNLNYLQDFSGVPHGLDDFIVFKCGVLITSLFVFFTTTMSVSFTLRETQSRMLKFTVQLQHHARHRLPTYRLIFVHVVESLVFVPIMIGILFFLFEFFDDQLLAFMVLTLVWLCELFTMISARTVLSMQYFPRFFFLYFMVFHIYFFSYTYGFSYLAFSTAGAFMQHLVLYFWNRFEVPALQAYLRRRTILHHQGVHIHSTLFATTVQVARASPNSGANQQGDAHHQTSAAHGSSLQNPYQGDSRSSSNVGRSGNSNDILSGSQDGVGLTGSGTERSSDVRASRESLGGAETGVRLSHGSDNALAPPTAYTAFGSVLPWIFGGPTGGIVSLLPIFRETRDQGFDSAAVPQQDDLTQRSWQRASSSEEGLRHRQAQQPEGNAS